MWKRRDHTRNGKIGATNEVTNCDFKGRRHSKRIDAKVIIAERVEEIKGHSNGKLDLQRLNEGY
jgi:hypothetical protein